MDRYARRPPSPERTSSTEDIHSDTSSETSSQPPTPDAVITKPPTLRPAVNNIAPTPSPLMNIHKERGGPPPPPNRMASGLRADVQARVLAFQNRRVNTASPAMAGRNQASPGQQPPIGGLGAKRKPMMNLKDAVKKDATAPAQPEQPAEKETQFTKFNNIVDTKNGRLNFKDKAIISKSGIEFAGGTSFQISLADVQTMDELGKGNYGTVFKVRHAKTTMRRPGQGLRGNMPRHSSVSGSLISDDASQNGADGGTTGLVMAMKEIRLELEDSKFAAIIMELDILHRCISPFIIDFYGAFFEEGSVYICIEYMDGGSIDKIYGGGIPEGVLKKITLSTVMGLKSLKEEHNIIHRDVKPTNILVNSRGQVKICDFGVSGNLVASIAKTNIGCQSYMAPERISGGGMSSAGSNPGGTYSVQSDIWSLGLTIIECALGRYPYPPETYDNIFSQLQAIVEGDPPDLPAESYSETARAFVKGCLNKIPKMRPTYAALIHHPWLNPLMQPPTIVEDEEAEKAAEAGDIQGNIQGSANGALDTADKEVANWVQAALERKRAGKMPQAKKPALHEAPLDAVPGSPLANQKEAAVAASQIGGIASIEPMSLKVNSGSEIELPSLQALKIQDVDFAT